MKNNNPMHDPAIVAKATTSLIRTLELHPEKRLNVRMAKYRKSGKMTWIEQRMSQLLDRLGIEYVFQYPILRYDVDFAIPGLKIAIECDGEQWHQDKEKDLIRQQKIEAEGWFVLRYSGVKINQCLDEIEDEVIRVLSNHNGDYEFVGWPIEKIEKRQVKKPLTLYNLAVEEDESYLAKGMIVHNCRCAWIIKPREYGHQ
jgi:very-short-patch-repair endonuclease